jgi:hypothetical protein
MTSSSTGENDLKGIATHEHEKTQGKAGPMWPFSGAAPGLQLGGGGPLLARFDFGGVVK